MSLQTALNFGFEFGNRPIQVEESQSLLSSDAGLLIFRQMDEGLRYTEQFAAALGVTRAWDRRTRGWTWCGSVFMGCSRTTKIRTITTRSAAIRSSR